MPAPEISFRRQTALLWVKTGVDAYNQEIYSSPTELQVRWETGRSEALDPMGNRIAVDARVVVNQDIDIGSLMWEGTQEEWEMGTGSGGIDDEIMQVVTFNKATDVKGRRIRREVGLMKYRDTTPNLG